MYQVGDRVRHNYKDGHGEGTVREVRAQVESSSLYNPKRYPYVVEFDSGFKEVYAEQDLAPV
jgi:hypothetical protein